ncbi:MAG: isocitrate/isopropylmalate family dehydrogenase [Fidelibacterota bacterium]
MKIVLLTGDGVGSEIASEVKKLLAVLGEIIQQPLEIRVFEVNESRFLDTDILIPNGVLRECKRADAVWVGPLLERSKSGAYSGEQVLNRLLEFVDCSLYYRHIQPMPVHSVLPEEKELDIIVLESRTYGSFSWNQLSAPEFRERYSLSLSFIDHEAIKKLVDFALGLIKEGSRRKLILALPPEYEHAANPWGTVYSRLQEQDIPFQLMGLDKLAFHLVHNPEVLDLVLTVPPFGKLFSRLGAALEGGLGMSYESYLKGDGQSVHHILHPPSVRYVGKNAANPVGSFLAIAEVFEGKKEKRLANMIRKTVDDSLRSEWATRDLGGSMGTAEVGDYICAKLAEQIQ